MPEGQGLPVDRLRPSKTHGRDSPTQASLADPSREAADPIDLDSATTLVPQGGRFCVELSPRWGIWGPSGGYLASLTLRAAGELATIRRPTGISCQFLRPARFGPADLEAEVLHVGRRSEVISVQLRQHGKVVAHSVVRTLAAAPGYDLPRRHPPQVSRPDATRASWPGSAPVAPDDNTEYPFWVNLERRPASPARASASSCTEWVRFLPVAQFANPFVDATRMLMLLDVYGWPAAFAQVGPGRYIAPSVDITAWFHCRADHADWLLIDAHCPSGGDGLLAAEGHVWSEAGELLATGAAHLCCIPNPRLRQHGPPLG